MPEKIRIPRLQNAEPTGKSGQQGARRLDSVLEGVRVDDIYRSIASLILAEVEKRLSDNEEEKKIYEEIPGAVKEIIAGDIFYTMFKYNPRVKDKKQFSSDLQVLLADFLKKFMSSKKYKVVHRLTRLNRTLSFIFSVRFTKSFIASLAREDPDKAEEVINKLKALAKCQGGMGGGSHGQSQQGSGQGSSQAGNTGGRRQQAGKQQGVGSQAGAGLLEKKLRETIERTLTSAMEEASTITEAAGLIPGLGQGFEPGHLAFMDADIGVNIVELGEVLKFLGSIMNSMPVLTKKYKKKSRIGFPEGYTLTSNPEKALPRELALPEELFMVKLVTGRFLAKERREPVSSVVIVLLDKSDSMKGYKIAWAKAVAYALEYKARKSKADWILIPFDTIAYNPVTSDKIHEVLRITASGGTNIGNVLVKALEYAVKNKYEKANIIVITDGIDDYIGNYIDNVLSLAKKIKSSVKVVFIGSKSDYKRNEDLIKIVKATGGDVLMTRPTEEGAIRVIQST